MVSVGAWSGEQREIDGRDTNEWPRIWEGADRRRDSRREVTDVGGGLVEASRAFVVAGGGVPGSRVDVGDSGIAVTQSGGGVVESARAVSLANGAVPETPGEVDEPARGG